MNLPIYFTKYIRTCLPGILPVKRRVVVVNEVGCGCEVTMIDRRHTTTYISTTKSLLAQVYFITIPAFIHVEVA